jgi:hypothetical protein
MPVTFMAQPISLLPTYVASCGSMVQDIPLLFRWHGHAHNDNDQLPNRANPAVAIAIDITRIA